MAAAMVASVVGIWAMVVGFVVQVRKQTLH